MGIEAKTVEVPGSKNELSVFKTTTGLPSDALKTANKVNTDMKVIGPSAPYLKSYTGKGDDEALKYLTSKYPSIKIGDPLLYVPKEGGYEPILLDSEQTPVLVHEATTYFVKVNKEEGKFPNHPIELVTKRDPGFISDAKARKLQPEKEVHAVMLVTYLAVGLDGKQELVVVPASFTAGYKRSKVVESIVSSTNKSAIQPKAWIEAVVDPKEQKLRAELVKAENGVPVKYRACGTIVSTIKQNKNGKSADWTATVKTTPPGILQAIAKSFADPAWRATFDAVQRVYQSRVDNLHSLLDPAERAEIEARETAVATTTK